MLDGCTIISADSHAAEPVELLQRLSEEYGERAPRLERMKGRIYYIQEGNREISW